MKTAAKINLNAAVNNDEKNRKNHNIGQPCLAALKESVLRKKLCLRLIKN
ncbi:hypothetical protein [Agaribacterium haliotis]|nr:hypothetical protein [Agaribacterium haliotis]